LTLKEFESACALQLLLDTQKTSCTSVHSQLCAQYGPKQVVAVHVQ